MGVERFAAKRISIWGCEGKNAYFLVFGFSYVIQLIALEGDSYRTTFCTDRLYTSKMDCGSGVWYLVSEQQIFV